MRSGWASGFIVKSASPKKKNETDINSHEIIAFSFEKEMEEWKKMGVSDVEKWKYP